MRISDWSSDVCSSDLHVRLRDRFGDNGLIAVVVLRQDCDRLHVDTWVMSCRVLGRTVEEFTANAIRRVALRRGCRTIVGAYRPSPKNGMVAELYDRLGSERVSGDGDVRLWLQVVARGTDGWETLGGYDDRETYGVGGGRKRGRG